MSRSIEEIAQEFEKYAIQMNEQRYNQKAGFEYNKDRMEAISQVLLNLSNEFLNSYTEPRSFYLNCISTIADARKLPIEISIYETRNRLIASDKFQFNEKPVNWGSWRQFNAQANNKDRKDLFDEFIIKAPEIASLIEKKFNISKQVYSIYGSSPLQSYLEKEFISYDNLIDLVTKIGDESKKPFLAAADHYAPEILGKDHFEYFDDFYVARGKIYSPLNKYFTKKNPLKIIRQILVDWGFEENLSRISVDSEDREKKSPSAFCFSVSVPNDIRVIYKKVSPFSDFTSIFHEFGHAIHGSSGIPTDPFWVRYLIPMSVAETFSIFLETLLENPLFLEKELDLPEEAINEIIDRRHFMGLYFLVFYSANSLMKLEYWKRDYSIDQASSVWANLTKRFYWEIPGNYWLLHHITPNYDLYAPSYILASIRAYEWINQMMDEYGELFWREKQAGGVFHDLAATRGLFDLSVWDMNPNPYLESQMEFSYNQLKNPDT
ncbi:M3 family metallopeptidase [Candidatus Hodarchaeum mangrovi]